MLGLLFGTSPASWRLLSFNMKDEIQALVRFNKLVTAEELYTALSKDKHIVRKTFQKCLQELENQGVITKVLAGENALGIEGFMEGPNLITGDFESNLLLNSGLDRRDLGDISYPAIVKRLSMSLKEEVTDLKERISLISADPKTLEMDYFSLALKYHEVRGYFLNFEIDAFNDVKTDLDDCRRLLDSIEI